MIGLPADFLPFDPHENDKENGNGEDGSCSESDDDLSNDDQQHPAMSNGVEKHEPAESRHIGGGVLLVRCDVGASEESDQGDRIGFGQ